MPSSALDEYRQLDAILLGALGDPRVEPGLVEHSVIMGLRVGLDLYVNLRPITLYAEHLCPLKDKRPEDVDFIVVRENTEDAYTGPWGLVKKGTPDEIAMATMLYTRKGTERVIRYAFDLARKRGETRNPKLETNPGRQSQCRPRPRHLDPHLRRGGSGVSRRRTGSRLRGRLLHVDAQEPGVVRRHRHHQHIRRHHH
jgi:isocitrate dehydrogenase